MIDNISIAKKVTVLVAFLAALSLAVAGFLCSRLSDVDDEYSRLIDHADAAAFLTANADRSFSDWKSDLKDLIFASTDMDIQFAKNAMAETRRRFDSEVQAVTQLQANGTSDLNAIASRARAAMDSACAHAIKLAEATSTPQSVIDAYAVFQKECVTSLQPISKAIKDLASAAKASADAQSDQITAKVRGSIQFTIWAAGLGVSIAAFFALFIARRSIVKPIGDLQGVMERLAAGDSSLEIPHTKRQDEIGQMAVAVELFKEAGQQKTRLEMTTREAQAAAEAERTANEATRAELQRHQENVVLALASGLDHLAKGDLTRQLDQNFSTEYEKLRVDFNAAAASLREAMRRISESTDGISNGSDQIASASDDLSRRTEQQAASLEETSAAMNGISETVVKMAANAGEAAHVVATTRDAAESSGLIVQQAVEAMGKIRESSQQITNIIGVIDEIAFQTNLLALNAGVEAARAGDAGRGFAVVASEVRALAQRSAEAAKEIKALISASTVQVESGVGLVDRTGTALRGIIEKIKSMDTLLQEISASSKEQATGLNEINTAISQMDQVVQQNAAMVEESTAAAHALKAEAQGLSAMVGKFLVDAKNENGRSSYRQFQTVKSQQDLGGMSRPVRPARPGLRKANDVADREWAEF